MMGSMVEILALEDAEFFAPVSSDLIDSLTGQYQQARKRIEEVADVVGGEIYGGVMHYFFSFAGRDSRYSAPPLDRLFQKNGAVAALNSAYWSKAMQLTDVLNYMPQARRDEWNKSIQEMTCPEFEADTVRSTLAQLLNMRSQFLAERVDGIFRGLSGEHVTNSPAAFGKRMIVSRVLSGHCGYEDSSTCGLINDLRCVVAKFMGRDEPGYNASAGLIRSLKGRWGEWVTVDGGALRVRLYMKGTAHIEVHPDMAWRLNSTLAHLYPLAIPPEFRSKPKRKAKQIDLIQRPLPFAVIEILTQMTPAARHEKTNDWRNPVKRTEIKNSLSFDYVSKGKHARAEAESVLESIGGVKDKEGWYQFDYSPKDVLSEIVSSGCIPDQKAHQFYPTPASLAQRVIDLAEIGAGHTCLEPSAGTGGLAQFMPSERTRCVEVSALHCKVLAGKGFAVDHADFLAWAPGQELVDRVVMNPPFDQGRWKAHLEAAAEVVKAGGRLVAILPSGAKNQDVLAGFVKQWHGPFDNEFAGTSVSVVVLVACKP